MIRTTLRWLLAALYAFAGYAHVASPATFLAIMPPLVPWPEAVVLWTGIAELLGAAALAQPFWPQLRRAGAIGLALYALCVWPANINHMVLDMASPDGGPDGRMGLGYHIPRMFAQPLIIWLALWVGQVIDWPFRPRRQTPR